MKQIDLGNYDPFELYYKKEEGERLEIYFNLKGLLDITRDELINYLKNLCEYEEFIYEQGIKNTVFIHKDKIDPYYKSRLKENEVRLTICKVNIADYDKVKIYKTIKSYYLQYKNVELTIDYDEYSVYFLFDHNAFDGLIE